MAFFKKKSALGLDQIYYSIIQAILTVIHAILLDIYNDIFAKSLFPPSWHAFLFPKQMTKAFVLL